MSSAAADVVVVGGGVAGSAIARLLGEAGHGVIVLEKAHFPRDKPCGEGIMPTGVRLLDHWGILGHIPSAERHPIRGVRFVIGGAISVQGDFPDIGDGHRTGLGVRRLLLDEVLLRRAQSHPNVIVHEGEPAIDVRRNGSGAVEILTPSGCYRARIVVGADGLRSLVRRRLGLPVHCGRRKRFGMRTHYRLPAESRLDDYVCVRIDAGDQCFTTPIGDKEVQVSLLVEKDGMKSFAGRLDEAFGESLARRPQICELLANARRISPVLTCGPFDVWPQRRAADRAVLVGDAGGYLDPITGEGISLALQGAIWAGEVIDEALRCNDLTARRLLAYDHRFTRSIRHYRWLTRALLIISRHQQIAKRVVAKLSRCPELYTKLLGVNCGMLSLADVPSTDWLRFMAAPSRAEATTC